MSYPSFIFRRNATVALVCVGAVVLGVLAVKRTVNGNSDLSANHRIWRANLTQTSVHVRREGDETQDPDAYPPITYALYAPLGALPIPVVAVLWYLVNLGCSVFLYRAAGDWLESYGDLSRVPLALAGYEVVLTARQYVDLAVVAVLPAWFGCLLLGQNTLFLMTLTWVAYRWAKQRPWVAGLLLALATVLKVLPCVFLLPFVLRWNLRVLAAYALSGLILVLGLGSLYFGPRENIRHHWNWLEAAVKGPVDRPANPHDPNSLRGSLRYHNESVETVLARLLMDVPITNQPNAPRVNILKVTPETWRRTKSILTAVLSLMALITVFRKTRIRSGSPIDDGQFAETSVENYAILSLFQLLVSPIVWSHYYVWLLWPFLLLLRGQHVGRKCGIILYGTWLLTLPFLAIPEARAVGLHLWVTIAIFVWLCWRSK